MEGTVLVHVSLYNANNSYLFTNPIQGHPHDRTARPDGQSVAFAIGCLVGAAGVNPMAAPLFPCRAHEQTQTTKRPSRAGPMSDL